MTADTLSIVKILEDTTADGPGFRMSVYSAGCSHHCEGCQNPSTWEISAGTEYTIDSLTEKLLDSVSNITFSGGDPLFQVEGFTELAQRIKNRSQKNIWCYTGFLYEDIIKSERLRMILPYIDVLVDGRFEKAKKDTNLLFKGSANQRLIDIKESLKTNKIVIFDYNPFPIF